MTRVSALFAAFAAALFLCVGGAAAQTEAADDKSFLEGLLQDSLSAAGRQVEVTGFAGALSSRATMERLTVADDEGIWLTIEGAVLDWSRAALLTGRLKIDALTAERIDVARPPVAVSDGPQAASSDFALPELPVSIDIGALRAKRLSLGAPLLGEAVELTLEGSGQLEGGAGEAAFRLERIDGQTGLFDVQAGYANDSAVLTLDLDLSEGPGGIIARLTGLPDGAPLAFQLAGTGPIDAYTAEMVLATDGAERIGGEVTLNRAAPEAPMAFRARLEGDPTPLMAADYRAFFGRDVRLVVDGQRDADGRLDLKTLDLATEALALTGSAVIAPGGWAERVALTGEVAAPGGGPVRLPIGGEATEVAAIGLSLQFDTTQSDDWRADVTLDGLTRPDLTLTRATLTGRGTISPGANGALPAFGGQIDLTASGLAGPEGSVAAAFGPELTGRFDLARTSGQTLDFRNLTLGGADFRLDGDVVLDTLAKQLELLAEGAVTLSADDLSRFAPLAGQALSGAARLRIAGNAALPGGPFDVEITGSGDNLGIGVPEADRLFAGASTLALAAKRGPEGTEIERFDIAATGASATGTGWLAETGSQLALRLDLPDAAVVATGLDGPLTAEATAVQGAAGWDLKLEAVAPGATRLRFAGLAATEPRGVTALEGELSATIGRLTAWSALAGRPLAGAARLSGNGRVDLASEAFTLDVTGTGQDLRFDLGPADALTAGASELTLSVQRRGGVIEIARAELASPTARVTAAGQVGGDTGQLTLTADLPDGAVLAAGLTGPISAEATALQQPAGWDLTLDATAPGGTALRFTGLAEGAQTEIGAVSGDLTASVARLGAWSGLAGRRLAGALQLSGSGRYEIASQAFSVEAEGTGQGLDLNLGAADPLTAGRADLSVTARRDAEGVLFIDALELTTPELSVSGKGEAVDGQPRANLTARLSDLGRFVPGLPGPLKLSATAALTEAGWQMRAQGAGPGGTTIDASGTVAADVSRADLSLRGRAPLALANQYIRPRELAGMAVYDLRLSGPLALTALSGTIRSDGARLAVPTLGRALDPLVANLRLSGGQVEIDASGRVSTGGEVAARGSVGLTGGIPANLTLGLQNVHLRDESLYDLTLGGNLRLSGPLAADATITGSIVLGKVELRIPETGLGAGRALEGLRHIGAPPAVRQTLTRSGQTVSGRGGGGAGPGYGLGIIIEAPAEVFVRGRGLDAELGGTLTVGGTTNAAVTTGGVNLIRGRLDILGNRLALTEGSATLRGSLDPYLRLLAETEAADVSVQIAVEGLASDPAVTFTSSPDLPQDEILARLIFGRGIDQISPLQAVKLASAVATLAGRGGAGTIGRLREGFGLDDFDVTTDENGELEVKAGTYLSENAYTDVTVGADGQAEINLNLTLTPNITARGTVGSDGATGIGVYFERDY